MQGDEGLWLEDQMLKFKRAGGGCVVVVLGFHRGQYLESLPWLQSGDFRKNAFQGLEIIAAINSRPEDGPFFSLLAGFSALHGRTVEAVWVLPVDVPCPATETFLQLLSAATEKEGTLACIPMYEGRGGHPVLLNASLFSRFETLASDDPEARLDTQIRKLPSTSVRRVEVIDPSVRVDINTPEELARYLRKRG